MNSNSIIAAAARRAALTARRNDLAALRGMITSQEEIDWLARETNKLRAEMEKAEEKSFSENF